MHQEAADKAQPVCSLSCPVTGQLVEVLKDRGYVEMSDTYTVRIIECMRAHPAFLLLQPHPEFVTLEEVVGLRYLRDAIWQRGSFFRRKRAIS